MPTYIIAPNPAVPAREILSWYRHLWLCLTLRRPPRVVIQTTDGVLVCHPSTVKWVTEYLRQGGHKYQVRTPLSVVGQK